jgi:cytochrome P450
MSSSLEHASSTPLVDAERRRMVDFGRTADTLVLRDDPDHARLRRLIQAPFGPRAVETLRAMIHERVHSTLDTLIEAGAMDVIGDFAYPLPVAIFCAMFGVPDEDTPHFRAWTAAVARNLDPLLTVDERDECMRLLDDMQRYLEDQIEAKRRHPGDDVLSVLVHAEEDGDRLTRDELVAQVVTLYVAGHEPTTALIGGGVLGLLRFPDQLAALRRDRDLMGGAVHEFLRYDGPNQFVRRIATTDRRIGERDIAAGQVVYVGVGAANRDPAHWGADVDAVRVDRPGVAHHLQFGAGIHTCLGTHLARLQAEIALDALLDRLGAIELAAAPVWSPRMIIRGLQSLPISFSTQ